MQELILLKLGELVLKGLNRHVFEERLCANIRRRIKHCGKFQILNRSTKRPTWTLPSKHANAFSAS